MIDGRKRVDVCSTNPMLGPSLRHLLDGHVIMTSESSPDDLDADVVIWQLDEPVHNDSLARVAAEAPTLVLAHPNRLLDAVDAGCKGFLPESASLSEIGDAVETILRGGAVVPPDLLGTLLRHLVVRNRREAVEATALEELTDREMDVFESAATGANREMIAEQLFISPQTVRTHLQRVYRKLGIHSQVELISLAVRLGITTPEE